MDEASLVRLIVAEVVKRLAADGKAGSLAAPVNGRLVRVLAFRGLETAARIEPLIQERFGADARLVFNNEAEEGDFACRLVPRLSCTDLADLALGTARTDEARRLLAEVHRGHALEVVSFEHLELERTLPHKLFALYEGYRKTLEGYGVTSYRSKLGGSTRVQTRLVTAKEVEEAAREGTIRLLHGADALVTPLARDMADELGITLVKDGDIS